MRILILADINSSHTLKWVNALLDEGCEVAIFSLHPMKMDRVNLDGRVEKFAQLAESSGVVSTWKDKLTYIFALNRLKQAIKSFGPDLIHAHYASSYGLLGRLAKFKPFFISVWGSDVLRFPKQGWLQKRVVIKNLRAANRIFTTSDLLTRAVKELTCLESVQLPFGIDVNRFFAARTTHLFSKELVVFGTVKSLEPVYRIDRMIEAFAVLVKQTNRSDLRLLLVGGGSQENKLQALVKARSLESFVHFTGFVPHEDVTIWHQQMDVFIHASLNESFGVSILEASACGKAVIACNSGGVAEVVVEKVTGLMYGEQDFDGLMLHMNTLLGSEYLRMNLGRAGREFVCQNYSWSNNVQSMMNHYQETIAKWKVN
jgi:L-malate glycosyltransferase